MAHAAPLLERYRHHHAAWNDDIQVPTTSLILHRWMLQNPICVLLARQGAAVNPPQRFDG